MTDNGAKTGGGQSPALRTRGFTTGGAHGVSRPAQIVCHVHNPEETGFGIDIPPDSDKFTALLEKEINYAEHKISRTPDAWKRTQASAQPQREIKPARAGKKTSAPPSPPGKRTTPANSCPTSIPPRQGRQIRRPSASHRQPEKVAPDAGAELSFRKPLGLCTSQTGHCFIRR